MPCVPGYSALNTPSHTEKTGVFAGVVPFSRNKNGKGSRAFFSRVRTSRERGDELLLGVEREEVGVYCPVSEGDEGAGAAGAVGGAGDVAIAGGA